MQDIDLELGRIREHPVQSGFVQKESAVLAELLERQWIFLLRQFRVKSQFRSGANVIKIIMAVAHIFL